MTFTEENCLVKHRKGRPSAWSSLNCLVKHKKGRPTAWREGISLVNASQSC